MVFLEEVCEKIKNLFYDIRRGCSYIFLPLSSRQLSVGLSTIVMNHWLLGILGPIPSAALDKSYLFELPSLLHSIYPSVLLCQQVFYFF